jgi:hypothetical protein
MTHHNTATKKKNSGTLSQIGRFGAQRRALSIFSYWIPQALHEKSGYTMSKNFFIALVTAPCLLPLTCSRCTHYFKHVHLVAMGVGAG